MAGERSIRHGLRGDRRCVPDQTLGYLRLCDRLIAEAEGDAPLQEFWRGVKGEFQADLPCRDKPATPNSTCLVALGEWPDIPVGQTPVIVGRDPWCDTRIDSIRVSRIHCCLTVNQGKVVVLDLGSANGTRINDRLVELGQLLPGDELSIAHLRYRVGNRRSDGRTLASLMDGLTPRPGPPGEPPPGRAETWR